MPFLLRAGYCPWSYAPFNWKCCGLLRVRPGRVPRGRGRNEGGTLDGIFLAGAFFSKFKKGRYDAPWEERVVDEVIRLTEGCPGDVTIVIPALQIELGTRLELTSKLMKQHGYRLRQVIPDSGTTWAASFMRLDDD